MGVFCPDCGLENNEGSKFCNECGSKIETGNGEIRLLLDGRYEIEAIVKQGGMGCVYKAFDTRLNVNVAVKKLTLKAENQDDADYAAKRFMKEARLLSELHFGNLPKVIDFFVTEDPETGRPAHFLVMTFIDGIDFETLMKEAGGGPLETENVISHFREILLTLDYLHSQTPPIIYRDLKPSNIMIQEDKVFLIDFGIAKEYSQQGGGTIIGTPGYASPEQYKGFTDQRSDLYSLGALIHYLLSGRDPEDTSLQPFDYPLLKDLNPEVPGWLNDLIESLLQFRADDRPKSALEVIDLLERRGLDKSSMKIQPLTGVNRMDSEGNTLLHEAVMEGKFGEVKVLIKDGADPNIRNHNGMTPLHRAAALGHDRITDYLMANGADPTIKNNRGLTPLDMANRQTGFRPVFATPDLDAEETMKNVVPGMTPLHKYAQDGNLSLIKLLIAQNNYIDETDDYGNTPLHYAVYEGHIDVVNFLLENGADPRKITEAGITPLHAAASRGVMEAINLLLNWKAPIDAGDSEGKSPLFLAVEKKREEIVKTLIAAGADVKFMDNEGETPLHEAAAGGDESIVKLLIESGAFLNVKNDNGSTPVHRAAYNGHLEIVSLLLSHGANVNIKNIFGFTPLDYAYKNDHRDVIDLLKVKGAKEATFMDNILEMFGIRKEKDKSN